jgi:hypothetical protein
MVEILVEGLTGAAATHSASHAPPPGRALLWNLALQAVGTPQQCGAGCLESRLRRGFHRRFAIADRSVCTTADCNKEQRS